ncbi:hypothetical protein CEXT_335371 [Caerostris extrusa]|uniref:Uncharacterized protein n=1 Tax=Caerostris extrusa TaxID=172846 RepID=A0AAV4NQC8_CAEEX|nr:hypothetical protein CEXT_335371 [Caerostris extrusa]
MVGLSSRSRRGGAVLLAYRVEAGAKRPGTVKAGCKKNDKTESRKTGYFLGRQRQLPGSATQQFGLGYRRKSLPTWLDSSEN